MGKENIETIFELYKKKKDIFSISIAKLFG